MSKRIVLFQALTATVSDLRRMLLDIDRQLFCRRLSPDGWSMADVLRHLIAVEKQYFQRLQRVLIEERPFLPAILPDPTIRNLQASPAELLVRFEEARQKTLAFLQDMTDDEWRRTAVHETQGAVTFHFLVQYLIDHDSEHLNQIAAIQQLLNAVPDHNAQPTNSE